MKKGKEAFKQIVKHINTTNEDLTKELYEAVIVVKSELDELDFIKTFFKREYNLMITEKARYEWALKELENVNKQQ